MSEISRDRRREIVRHLALLETQMFGPGRTPGTSREAHARQEALLAEYGAGLPRRVLSHCPFCSALLVRSFDPYGLDGPWWWEARIFTIEEPPACPHFKVVLGAVDLGGREPHEVKEQVFPGPGAPFVVPDLLALPSMKAVAGRIALETGDRTYPIAYFSPEKIHPSQLHQPWGRQENWFKTENGQSGWNISNSRWDFELTPYLADGRLHWVDLASPGLPLLGTPEAPWGPSPGIRAPQQVVAGQIGELPLPSGESGCPFE